MIQNFIERHDILDWQEGTKGHYPHAPESFRRFLRDWEKRDGRWFGEPGDEDSAQTWLVDTGDLTTFGDEDSIELGRSYLDKWRKELGGVRCRALFGNHDAWPEAHPAVAIAAGFGNIQSQRKKIYTKPGWEPLDWLNKFLSVAIPGTDSRIELYALDTVAWKSSVNALAAGILDRDRFNDFRRILRDRWSAEGCRHFRILATHHPLFFPYRPEEEKIFLLPSMRLLDSEKWSRELRNDKNDPPGLGPLVHLFLSGHTHAAYPAGELPANVTEIHQGLLHEYQLQLVGGPLMLNKSADQSAEEAVSDVNRDPCQAQILRFYSDTDRPGQLVMYKTRIWSQDGSEYLPDHPVTKVRMYYDTL